MNKTLIICLITISILLFNLSIVYSKDDVVSIPLKSMNITEPQKQVMSTKSLVMGIKTSSIESSDIKNIKEKVDGYIKENVGKNYFDKHFIIKSTKEEKDTICVDYEYVEGEDKADMHICYDTLKNRIIPQMSSSLETPQEILFKKPDAIRKAEDLSLHSPKDIKLVYYDGNKSLGWKILWEHEPTIEERRNNTVQGYIFSVVDGSILKTYKFHFEIGVPNLSDKENILEEKVKEEVNIIKKIINFLSKIWKG